MGTTIQRCRFPDAQSGRRIKAMSQRALDMFARHGGFENEIAQQMGGLNCAARDNSEGQVLALCLFSGGHSFRLEHLRAGLELLK